jgi:multidrug efflux pump subunit AcrA (membrane-fusion protein)
MVRFACLIFGAALIFLHTAAYTQQTQSQNSLSAPIAVAQQSEQFHTISVGGRLQPKNRIIHRAQNPGIVRTVYVEEGAYVEEGQRLFSTGRKDDVEKIYEPVMVTARIAGWVSEVSIQEEDEIEDSDPAVTVIGTEGYTLKALISDKDAFKIRIGQSVAARTTGGTLIRGVLSNRSQEPDYDTGLFTLTFEFPNSQATYIGEFVLIDLPVDRTVGVFIRRDSVIRRYGQYFVWIVNEDRVLEAREVGLGSIFGDLVEIDDGLQPGEKYLSRLSGREKEGVKIEAPSN